MLTAIREVEIASGGLRLMKMWFVIGSLKDEVLVWSMLNVKYARVVTRDEHAQAAETVRWRGHSMQRLGNILQL